MYYILCLDNNKCSAALWEISDFRNLELSWVVVFQIKHGWNFSEISSVVVWQGKLSCNLVCEKCYLFDFSFCIVGLDEIFDLFVVDFEQAYLFIVLYICIYVYIYIYIYMYMYICIYVYMYICIHIQCICTYINIHVYMSRPTCLPWYTYIYIYIYIYKYICICACT